MFFVFTPKSLHLQQSGFSVNLPAVVCSGVLSGSVVSDSATPWTVALQAPLSIGLSRQQYWSGLPCPPPDSSS